MVLKTLWRPEAGGTLKTGKQLFALSAALVALLVLRVLEACRNFFNEKVEC